MKFCLVDRILELEPGRRIRTVKSLSLAEEYLADHFPTFPVLPGVLMIEALVQSAAWLVRAGKDFGPAAVVLRDARNVVYGNFVTPGSRLEVEIEADAWTDDTVKVRGVGKVRGAGAATADAAGETAVRGKLTLRFGDPALGRPVPADVTERLRGQLRRQFELLGGPAALKTVSA